MGCPEKIDCRAFYEAGFSGLIPESVLSDNIDLEDGKKAELLGVDFT